MANGETRHSRHQGTGDTWRDGVDIDVAGYRDRGEGDHDADHCSEQPKEWTAGDRDRQDDHEGG